MAGLLLTQMTSSIFFLMRRQRSLSNRQVWLGLGVSVACVIAVLNLIQRYLDYRSTIDDGFDQSEEKKNGRLRVTKWKTQKQYLYVFGNLLSQG